MRKLEQDHEFINELIKKLRRRGIDPHMLYSLIETIRISHLSTSIAVIRKMLGDSTDPILTAQCLRTIQELGASIDQAEGYYKNLVDELVHKYNGSEFSSIKGHCLIELSFLAPRKAIELYENEHEADAVIKYHLNYGLINSPHYEEFADYVK